MFSQVASRLDAEVNPLYRIRDELRSQGHTILDLISGNVNESGIVFPQDALEPILIRALHDSRIYHPDSFGQKPARQAVSQYYQKQGFEVPPENIVLTPGTSIAYWYCFKLLANDGDEILCPRPSYPLFDYIAALSGVRLVPYRLDEQKSWAIDLDSLEKSISTRTRALVLISPHNPTGHLSSAEEIAALAEIAARHELAIINDEVFSEFLHGAEALSRPADPAPVVITLNGFSKMFALPGMKLGWMALSGQNDRIKQALRALELISDTFLPVNEIVQAAVPDIFRSGETFLREYSWEIKARWKDAERILRQSRHVCFVPPGGGYYVTLQLLDLVEDTAAAAILRQEHCLVHPGFFYDIDGDHLVLSFVQEREQIRTILPRILRVLDHCHFSNDK